MPACPSCGRTNREGSSFCAFCGAPQTPPGSPAPAPAALPYSGPTLQPPRTEDECFGTPRVERREPDIPGVIGFAFFIIIVGVVFLANPGLPADFETWVKSFTPTGGIPRPPASMILSAIVFFVAAGVTDFIQAGMRFGIKAKPRKALGNVISGTAWIVLAGFTYLYLGRTISGPVVVASELVVIGLLIILYLVILSSRRALPRRM